MPYTITPMLVGVRNVDQGIMTYQQGYGKRIWLPMWSFLLREKGGEGRTILVDTGLEDFVNPPEFVEDTGLEALFMDEALAQQGLTVDDIDAVINTHLHDDHCGNNPMFEGVPIYVQRAELEACLNPHPLDYRYDSAFVEELDVRPVDGDAELFPGVRVTATPGHTPGTQAVTVETGEGPVVITGMCCSGDNFPENGPAICPGVHCDAFAAYDEAQKLKALRDEGVRLLPLHELSLAGKTIG
ncbi:MAG: N-acyl homoserine lactonase family protein [Oceanidesulfovibrio sp.]